MRYLSKARPLVAAVLGVFMLSACGNVEPESAATPPETLVIGFLPLENPQTLAPKADAFADYLSERLGMAVEAFIPTEYAPLVETLRSGKTHVAFMGSLATVMAHEFANARPILGEIQRGEALYRSQYYVRADSDIRSLADLAGRDVAFTSPTGGSGYVFPIGMVVEENLLSSGGDPRDFFGEAVFAGGDEQVLKAVLRGDVEAGATSDYAPNLFLNPDERAQLRVIATKTVPTHSVVVSDNLPDELVERIRAVLLEMGEPDNLPTLKSIYGADGFVETTIEDYQPVVDAARDAGFDFQDLIE